MNDTYTIDISMKSLGTNINSHNCLSALATEVMSVDAKNLVINMKELEYIASNQFAVLGCIMDTFVRNGEERTLMLSGVAHHITELIKKNGFCQHFDLEKLPDTNNTVIPYKYFSVDEIEHYERYLLLHLLNRDDLPLMTEDVKNNILDYLLEIFKNVKDHTTSKRIYTCGQFFPKSSMLYFTMVDAGETIPYNVRTYFEKYNQQPPENTLLWALQEGHTTSDDNGPRGIGLSLIKTFIALNKGCFYIVSGKSIYEITKKGERYFEMESSFPGTIVTLAFNLKDDAVYYMESGSIQEIQF